VPAPWKSHGTGRFETSELGRIGRGVVIEESVLVFQPEHVHIGDDVYIGHGAILKGDTRGELVIGGGSWLGERCYVSSAGGVVLGDEVALAPYSMILTSTHVETPREVPLLRRPLEFARVEIGDGSAVGLGAIVLPGTRLGVGVVVGAGAVVKGDFADYAVVAGVPGRRLRTLGASQAP
jgi:acetyltransferase-like isoleucine patch superfamily enzyme